MGTIKIINNSTFTDYSAVMRIGRFLAGDEYHATHDEKGIPEVIIKQQEKNTYIIVDVKNPR